MNNPAGDAAVGGRGMEEKESRYEMRALMDPSRTQVLAAPGKMSGDSFDVSGSELEDKDSGKGMGRI